MILAFYMQLYNAVKELKMFQEQSELKFQFKIGIEGIRYQKPANIKVWFALILGTEQKPFVSFILKTSGKMNSTVI